MEHLLAGTKIDKEVLVSNFIRGQHEGSIISK